MYNNTFENDIVMKVEESNFNCKYLIAFKCRVVLFSICLVNVKCNFLFDLLFVAESRLFAIKLLFGLLFLKSIEYKKYTVASRVNIVTIIANIISL